MEEARKMITNKNLEELAMALSKITGFRYIAFDRIENEMNTTFSNAVMPWIEISPRRGESLGAKGYWDDNGCDSFAFPLYELPDIDWSMCQFDCKEVSAPISDPYFRPKQGG